MDTILGQDRYNCYGKVERNYLPVVTTELTRLEKIKKFFMNMFTPCCYGEEDVAEWEFTTVRRRVVVAMLDDDCEFQDLVEARNYAEGISDLIGNDLTEPEDEDCEDKLEVVASLQVGEVDCPVVGTTPLELPVGSSKPSKETLIAEKRERLSKHLSKPRRRRKRAVAYCVVALVNVLRAKYYQLSDTEANRRLCAQHLMKKMREHHFRTVDIHLHVDEAVQLYFSITPGIKPSVYARK